MKNTMKTSAGLLLIRSGASMLFASLNRSFSVLASAKLLCAVLVAMLCMGGTADVYAQQPGSPGSETVKGVILDEYGEPLPAANIFLKDEPGVGTVSDASGGFRFPRKLSEGDVIVFSFVGFETQEYVIGSEVPESLEVKMAMYNEIAGDLASDEVYASGSASGGFWSMVKGWFD
ncbi:carboxypeptidase-like regulatory domain-containing protein [Roseivirga sp. BDSF3-8]|uniref:carboxypeptidase-like regulatory domain-containing protein n=1 Tax=Roseivirga sp. BDSF3-8 TaxID=3241598 RepID=UPI003531B3A7